MAAWQISDYPDMSFLCDFIIVTSVELASMISDVPPGVALTPRPDNILRAGSKFTIV
jgi:hypothetical protein